jgi:hypothetical protein
LPTREGVTDAVSGGYSVKPEFEPLGEFWVDGRASSHRAFEAPWHWPRAAIAISSPSVTAIVFERPGRISARKRQ